MKIPSLDTLQADVGKEMNDQMDKGTFKARGYETKISMDGGYKYNFDNCIYMCVLFGFCERRFRVQPILQRAEQDLMRTPRT